LDTVSIADLGVDTTPQFTVTTTQPPAERQRGVMVEDVAGLVKALKDKGLV